MTQNSYPNAKFLRNYENVTGIHWVKGYAFFKEQTFVDFIAEDDLLHMFRDDMISQIEVNHSLQGSVKK